MIPVPIIECVAANADGTADVAVYDRRTVELRSWLEYRMVDGDPTNLEAVA